MATNEQMVVDRIASNFARDGFVFPIDVMSGQKAERYRQQLESVEQAARANTPGYNDQLNYLHVILPFVHEIVSNQRILDAVESILGPDILVWGSTFFIKEPHSESFVSWHQDLRYWGLDSEDEVSAWLALSPVTEANGCMRFVPGSHRGALVDHRDSFATNNALTRGQEAVIEIADDDTICVPLAPGQISLHHGKLLHCSGPNRSDARRIGITINYIAAHVRQTVVERDYAMLVRGEDRFGHFELVPPPERELSADAIEWHRRVLAAQSEAIYDGAEPSPHS